MASPLPIPAVTALVARCWLDAETSIRESLAQRHPDKDEEFITQLFHDEFRQTIQEASATLRVEHAFVHDLKGAFPHLQHSGELRRIANGISATTTLHPRETEKKSGGDLGIMFVRPNVIQHDPSVLTVHADYRRGLLCQAKLKRRAAGTQRTRWGGFTPNQKKILPNRLDYLSLVLYEYTDSQRNRLGPFRWQPCSGAQFSEIEQWLKSGEFPDTMTSDKIITRLGRAQIGTDDRHIIEQFICPNVRDILIIKIGWPPGQEPPARIHVSVESQQQQQEQQVQVYQR